MEWTHRTCERCWFDGTDQIEPVQGEFDGGYRMPVQVRGLEPGPCCVCGGMTITGIFFRRGQDALLCEGRHEPDQYGQWSRLATAVPEREAGQGRPGPAQ